MPDTEKLHQMEEQLISHIQRFEEFELNDRKRWSDLISSQETMLVAQQHNTQNIDKLTVSTENLKESTKDIVEAWGAANGAIKVANAIGKFFKWLSGFSIIGFILVWVYEHMLSK